MTAKQIRKKLEEQGFDITGVSEIEDGYLVFQTDWSVMKKEDLQKLNLLPNFFSVEADHSGDLMLVFTTRVKKGIKSGTTK